MWKLKKLILKKSRIVVTSDWKGEEGDGGRSESRYQIQLKKEE